MNFKQFESILSYLRDPDHFLHKYLTALVMLLIIIILLIIKLKATYFCGKGWMATAPDEDYMLYVLPGGFVMFGLLLPIDYLLYEDYDNLQKGEKPFSKFMQVVLALNLFILPNLLFYQPAYWFLLSSLIGLIASFPETLDLDRTIRKQQQRHGKYEKRNRTSYLSTSQILPYYSVLAFLGLLAIYACSLDAIFDNYGIDVEGTATEIEYRHYRSGSEYPYCYYRFNYNGNSYEDGGNAEGLRLEKNQRVKVRIVPFNPWLFNRLKK